MEDILQAFSQDVEQSLDRALQALQQQENHGTDQPKNHDPNYRATKSQLQHLWHLETVLHELIARRILDTQRQLRDYSMSLDHSPLLSLSSEVLQVLAGFLEETGLWALEQATKDILHASILEQEAEEKNDHSTVDDHVSLENQMMEEQIVTDHDNITESDPYSISDNESMTKFGEDWNGQWVLLDRKRHSKSLLIGTSPRTRGVRFAMASHFARQWELQLLRQQQRQQQSSFFGNDNVLVIPAPPNHADKFMIYDKAMYQHDFQTFFDEGHPTPQVEFFIRITYHDDGNNNNSQVLLEGFQSNFQSLKHTHDAQDQGHHTYIGLGGDHHRNPYQRSQAVMVRNDIHLLKDYMGVSEKYFGLDSDDEEEEDEEDSDEDSDASSVEFHFKQWPEASRREFLNHVTITVVRFGRTHNDKDSSPSLMVVGTTSGYDESNQHFAMFRPVQLLSTDTGEDEFNDISPSPLRIGLGCGVGNSLHIVVKWQDDDAGAGDEAYDDEDEINVADALVEYYHERYWLD